MADPLADLTLVEMGTLLAGPFCGQLMGDFGANVIKVEAPGQGDPMREWGQEKAHGKSLWWPVIARNKKSVTLNLRVPEGQALARRLIKAAKRGVAQKRFFARLIVQLLVLLIVLGAVFGGLMLARQNGLDLNGILDGCLSALEGVTGPLSR